MKKQFVKDLPTPIAGKSDTNIGQPPIIREKVKTANKPCGFVKPDFSKSVWVSRLNPAVTNEQMVDFIIAKTDNNDKNQLNCRKLVKKDADLSELTYVSFKIDINDEHVDEILDPEIWP